VAAPTGRPVPRSATGIIAALNNRGRTPAPRRSGDNDGAEEET
jgi:hypothetical protein